MKPHRRLLMIPALLGLLGATAAHAHPYDSPLEFRKHRHADGRDIYTNIPKRCFRDGRLVCHGLHPIFPVPASTLPAEKPTPE